jgi:uncharacterized HAD superfamily protein
MRLLSQDGRYDVSYDLVTIRTFGCDEKYFIETMGNEYYENVILAIYSSQELVNFVLKRMREVYCYGYNYFEFESEEIVQKQKDYEENAKNKIPYKG